MAGALPVRINPLRLADQGASISGAIPLKQMRRLCESLLSQQGNARVALRFGRNASGVSTVDGELCAALEMQCQRCLRPVTKTITWNLQLAIVRGELAAAQLHPECDVLELESETVFTRDLVEDELLLSMPLVPMHEDPAACDAAMVKKLSGHPDVGNENAAPRSAANPFAVL